MMRKEKSFRYKKMNNCNVAFQMKKYAVRQQMDHPNYWRSLESAKLRNKGKCLSNSVNLTICKIIRAKKSKYIYILSDLILYFGL